MSTPKIGQRDAVGLTEGHASKHQASDRELWLALREELDALYAKLNADSGVNATDFNELARFEK